MTVFSHALSYLSIFFTKALLLKLVNILLLVFSLTCYLEHF